MVMKTIVLMISEHFPVSHIRYGEPTKLVDKLLKQKIHTIRENYENWVKRAELINSGNAFLSVRHWSGRPYRSRQVEIARISTIAIQKLVMSYSFADGTITACVEDRELKDINILSHNDGLALDDFRSWFYSKEDKFNGVIIHFTNLLY